jgi:hypothetical protein
LSIAGTDQAGAGLRGAVEVSRSGQSGASRGGGLIIAQFAKLVVRDHRKIPSLLVMLNWLCWEW